jgi:hypothetical protein
LVGSFSRFPVVAAFAIIIMHWPWLHQMQPQASNKRSGGAQPIGRTLLSWELFSWNVP